MKKLIQCTKPFLLMMLITLTTLVHLQAQVATNYNFASSAGTYTPITGGTVLGTVTQDDDEFDGLVLPFPFSFSGATMSHFAVTSNGFMTLATSSATAVQQSYEVIGDAFATNTNVISAFSVDLQGGVGTGELSYTTLGTAPNRTLVVQWKNYRLFAGTGTPYNFQIRLSETTNIINIVYGTFAGTSTDVQVGLRGSSATDYNNRATATNWSATTAGTTNAAICSITATVFPASGQTYTWSLASCIGVGGLTATAITTTTATLNWSANPSAVGGYNVQYRLFGAPTFTAFAGNPVIVGTSVNIAGLLPSSTYEFQVQTVCAGVGNLSSFSASRNFNTLCTSIASFPYEESFETIVADQELPNCTSRSDIDAVHTYAAPIPFSSFTARTGTKFGGFESGFGNIAPTGDYFYSAALALTAGSTYTFSVWYNTDGFGAWSALDAWVGTTQTPVGLVAIAGATVTSPNNTAYQELRGTFTVPSTGTYHVALRCGSTPGFFDTMIFDDLSVSFPCANVVFAPAALPSGDLTTTYNQTIAATGGTAPYVYSVSAGVIPAGLTFNTATGVISGTPTATSITPPTFTIKVTDATGCSSFKNYSITVTSIPCAAITVTPTSVPAGTIGTLYPPITFAATGIAGATYTYSVVAGTLPNGMTLTATGANAGRLTGTPTTRPAGAITVRARIAVGPSAGCFGTVTMNFVINCSPMTLTPTIPSSVINATYSQQLIATGGGTSGTFTYAVTTGTLPAGFSLSSSGILSGIGTTLSTPTSITITATRTNGCDISQTYTFGIVPIIAAPIQLNPMQISSSSFRARWEPVARAVKYRIYVATSNGFDGGSFAIGYVGLAVVGDTSILVQNLKPETKYYIQITAISSADEISPYSNLKDATTLSVVTSIDNALSSQVKVSPNPSKDKFLVDFGTLNLGKTTARVYDAQGKQVFSSEINTANTSGNANQTTISLGNMANGIYLLEITSNKGRILKRLVKE